jgi:hypothetical protein
LLRPLLSELELRIKDVKMNVTFYNRSNFDGCCSLMLWRSHGADRQRQTTRGHRGEDESGALITFSLVCETRFLTFRGF